MGFKRKRICLLGSTGSIGTTTLRVIEDYPDRFEIVGLSAHCSADALAVQVGRWRPVAACLTGGGEVPAANHGVRWFSGPRGALDLIDACEPDLVVLAMVGAAGLPPMLKALASGVEVALANKEVLVTAGELVMRESLARKVRILPLDSEHSAIFQCLDGKPPAGLRRIILTASGGPFRGMSATELESVSVEAALRHPTWSMGRKITIDSATMMNKGFEVIEGHHLFDIPVDHIQIAVHPQSIVHSMVEYDDGSVLAQLGPTDMYFPIAFALGYPERLHNSRFESLDLMSVGRLDFENYDEHAFRCPGFAYEAARRGGTYPAVLNAANEVAVELLLDGNIRFGEVADLIDAALQAHQSVEADNLEAIEAADRWARERTRAGIGAKH
jgi:1-deoxy-D-xylulose-5-phosphate reductoisomerase